MCEGYDVLTDDEGSSDDASNLDNMASEKRTYNRGEWRKFLSSFVAYFETVDTRVRAQEQLFAARQDWPRKRDVDCANRIADLMLAAHGQPRDAPQTWLILDVIGRMRKPYQKINPCHFVNFNEFMEEVRRLQEEEDRLDSCLEAKSGQWGINRPPALAKERR